MKKRTSQKQALILTAVISMILLGAGLSTFAQTGAGKPFGARDPRTCADTKQPTSGAMTTALATKYVICSQEHVEGENLYLIEDLTVQVGGAVPYNPNRFPFASDIDTKAPVYPIRASFKEYQCHQVSDVLQNKGYNCSIYPRPKATGVCVKTTFGDWSCTITSDDRSEPETNMPPPGGTKTVTTDNNKPTTAKNNQQQAETKTDMDENKNESGLPAPDFSEMEKYFDISKIEYSGADRRLYFTGKMTKKNNAVDWLIDFYDEEGIKMIPTSGDVVVSGDRSEVGDIAKYYFLLPPESKWKSVKKVVITRFKP